MAESAGKFISSRSAGKACCCGKAVLDTAQAVLDEPVRTHRCAQLRAHALKGEVAKGGHPHEPPRTIIDVRRSLRLNDLFLLIGTNTYWGADLPSQKVS